MNRIKLFLLIVTCVIIQVAYLLSIVSIITKETPKVQEIEKRAEPTIEQPRVLTAEQQAELNSKMIVAAAKNELETVMSLWQQGASVSAVNQAGQSALIAAAYKNHLEVARFLIEKGADVNFQDNSKQSAYLITTSEGYVELLKLTLANGADVKSLDSYNGTGLIRAADRGHVEIIRILLTTPINIDHINNLSWTALLEAVILGDGSKRYQDTVQLLVNAGANTQIRDNTNRNALDYARNKRFAEIVRILERGKQN